MKSLVQNIFVSRTTNSNIQFVRYFFVGGAAFLLDSGILTLFTECLHVYYLISAAVGFLFGLLFNFIVSVFWVFPKSKVDSRATELLIFGAVGVVGLGLNEVIMWAFTDIFLFHYLLSKVTSAVIVFLWNFAARKYLLYR